MFRYRFQHIFYRWPMFDTVTLKKELEQLSERLGKAQEYL